MFFPNTKILTACNIWQFAFLWWNPKIWWASVKYHFEVLGRSSDRYWSIVLSLLMIFKDYYQQYFKQFKWMLKMYSQLLINVSLNVWKSSGPLSKFQQTRKNWSYNLKIINLQVLCIYIMHDIVKEFIIWLNDSACITKNTCTCNYGKV